MTARSRPLGLDRSFGGLLSPSMARGAIARLGPALALVLVVAAFALLTEAPSRYLSATNLRIVLSQTVIVALGAIGMTMIIVSGGIDLSVGATIALSGVVAALGIGADWPVPAAAAAAVLAGGLVGLANGVLITGLRVVPFIATLGMLGIARGVAKWLAHEQTVNVPPTWLNDLVVTFPRAAWMVLSPGVWITLALAVLTATVLRRTVFGRRVFAVGSNELAARACGIATDRLKITIYGAAGLLFGLAGVMQLSRLRQGDPTVAIGTELDVIAAVVIGGGSLQGGEGSVFGSVVRALIMVFLRHGCQQPNDRFPEHAKRIHVLFRVALELDALIVQAPKHPYTQLLISAAPDPDRTSPPHLKGRGAPPSLLAPPSGCRFHPRCPVAFDACRGEEPDLAPTAAGHRAACLLT